MTLIKVTKEDWIKARAENKTNLSWSRCCPVACAIRRTLPDSNPRVQRKGIEYTLPGTSTVKHVPHTSLTSAIMWAADNYRHSDHTVVGEFELE